jgi:hypothetical protein
MKLSSLLSAHYRIFRYIGAPKWYAARRAIVEMIKVYPVQDWRFVAWLLFLALNVSLVLNIALIVLIIIATA